MRLPTPTVWLSYPAGAAEVALGLAAQLREGGVEVWLDRWCEPPVDGSAGERLLAMTRCEGILRLVLPAGEREPDDASGTWEAALIAAMLRRGDVGIFLLRVGEAAQLPEGLEGAPSISFDTEADRADALRRLLFQRRGARLPLDAPPPPPAESRTWTRAPPPPTLARPVPLRLMVGSAVVQLLAAAFGLWALVTLVRWLLAG